MRDIRADLRERIDAEKARREPLLRSLDRIDANIGALTKLLLAEEARIGAEAADEYLMVEGKNGSISALMVEMFEPPMPLQDFLLHSLAGGRKTLDELRDAAVRAGYFPKGGASPGRIVHGALLNPLRAGEVLRSRDGIYSMPEATKRKLKHLRPLEGPEDYENGGVAERLIAPDS